VLLYRMRRVQCRGCGVKVEEVPWGIGKHTLTRAYMLCLTGGVIPTCNEAEGNPGLGIIGG
jgi:hypothetical protein